MPSLLARRGKGLDAQRSLLLALAQASPALSPALRAFILSYATVVGPRIFNIVIRVTRHHNRARQLPVAVKHVLLSALAINELPIFWAALLASSVSLSKLTESIVRYITKSSKHTRLSAFIAAMIASGYTLRWHQNLIRRTPAVQKEEEVPTDRPVKHEHERGRTIDNTLFVFSSAIDYLFRHSLAVASAKRKVPDIVTIDLYTFVMSSAVVMYAWFYYPSRLPRSYNHWITKFADMDTNLLEALRKIKSGEIVYGKDTGQAHLLEEGCAKVGLPIEYGDPAKTVPIPCELVHANSTKNCELHAAWRFSRAFKSAFLIYAPLNLILLLRRGRLDRRKALIQALLSSCRSASFLGMFVALSWYSVCFTRSRIGKYVFPKIHPTKWDNTLGPALGCLMCGWSIVLELPQRRGDLALFVAPRALGAFFPTDFDRFHRYVERVVFSAAYAVVFSAAFSASVVRDGRDVKLRGVFGNAMMAVLGRRRKGL
ncbi:hypothetical protein V1512DRAFT_266816 [Lipomyces arxii]|uniref:uncharacterized protein n=1 Tax=Lipomyces arxii TaxID=56418 RepID=UPI0034CF4C49